MTLTLGVAFAAQGQTIINDTYSTDTHADGTALTAHHPNTNLPGQAYTEGDEYGAPVIESDTVDLKTNAAFGISIASSGTYVKPTDFTISGGIEIGTINNDGYDRGVALGFYSAADGPGVGTYTGNFTGLLLQPDGTLGLVSGGSIFAGSSQTQAYVPADFGGAAFSDSTFYTLSYAVDTTTGGISDVTLSDGSGSQTFSFTTTLFTSAQTAIAGGLSNSATSGHDGYFNAFSVVGPDGPTPTVPEPSTWALMLAGLVGLFGMHRFARKA